MWIFNVIYSYKILHFYIVFISFFFLIYNENE